MSTIKLTAAEMEAVRWAVGNFEMGDEADCDGKARHKAMSTAYAKLAKVPRPPFRVPRSPKSHKP
jgi:hypothetical protein